MEEEILFEFEIENESIRDNGLLLDLPLRDNIELKIGKGKVKFIGDNLKFNIMDGKRCLLLEPKTINLFRGFDIPIEIKENTIYSFNYFNTLDFLDENFNLISTISEFKNQVKSPSNSMYLKTSPFKEKENIKIQIEERGYNTDWVEDRRGSDILVIPTYRNIYPEGRIYLEFYPLEIIDKHYLFIFSSLQYPETNLSIYIENKNLYMNNILLKEVKLNSWNILDLNFKNSRFITNNIYIGDFIDNFYGYLRNLRIYKI